MSQVVLQQERDSHRLEREQKVFEAQHRALGNKAPQAQPRPRVYPHALESASPSNLSNGQGAREAPGQPCDPDARGSARDHIEARSRLFDLSAPIIDGAARATSANYYEPRAHDGCHAAGGALHDATRRPQLEFDLSSAQDTDMSPPARGDGADAVHTTRLSPSITATASPSGSNTLSLGYSFVEGDDMILSVTVSCSSGEPQLPGKSQPDSPRPHLMGLSDHRSAQMTTSTQASVSNTALSPVLSRACDGDTQPEIVAPAPKLGLDDIGDDGLLTNNCDVSVKQVGRSLLDNDTIESPPRDPPLRLGTLSLDGFSISMSDCKPVGARTTGTCPTSQSVANSTENSTDLEMSLSPTGSSSLSFNGVRICPVPVSNVARIAATITVLGRGSEGSDRLFHTTNGQKDAP